jgi:hypothetical protein
VVEIGNAAHAGGSDGSAVLRTRQDGAASKPRGQHVLAPLRSVPLSDWLALSEHAIEPPGYSRPFW